MTQTFDELMQGMTHYDKDHRFMAASDLTVFMLTSSAVDSSHQSRICSALVKQLEDTSLEVQGNAIKCIGRLMPVFSASEASSVIAKVIASMVDGQEELRDVFATGFKTFLPVISDVLAEVVFAAVIPRTTAIVCNTGSFSVATKEHVIDVTSEVVKRFGVLETWQTKTDALSGMLPGAIAAESSPGLRRRYIGLLGALAAVANVDELMKNFGERSGLDRLTLTKCISAISRGAGIRMVCHFGAVLPLLLNNISIPEDENAYEVVEVSLGGLETLSLHAEALEPYIQTLMRKIGDLVGFDPYGMSDEDAFGDADEQVDEDDESWKLRKAAAAVAVSLAKSRPGDVRTLLASSIRQRLQVEREEIVAVELIVALEVLETADFTNDFTSSLDCLLAQATRRGVGQKAVRAALAFLVKTSRAHEAARSIVATKCGNFLAQTLTTSLALETLEALEAAASGFVAKEAKMAMLQQLQQSGVLRSPQNRVHAAALRVAAELDTDGASLGTAVETLRDPKADTEVQEAAISVFVKFAMSPSSDLAIAGCSGLVQLTRTEAMRVRALKALEILVARNFKVEAAVVAECLDVAVAQFAGLRVFSRGVECSVFGAEIRGLLEPRLLRILKTAEGETAAEAVKLARIYWTSDAVFQKACLDLLLSPVTQASAVEELALFFENFPSVAGILEVAGTCGEGVQKHAARVVGGMCAASAEMFMGAESALHVRVLGDMATRRRLAGGAVAAVKVGELLRRITDAPFDEKSAAGVEAWSGLVQGYPEMLLSGYLPAVSGAKTAQVKAMLIDELAELLVKSEGEGGVKRVRGRVAEFLMTLAEDADEGCKEAAAVCLAAVCVGGGEEEMEREAGERLVEEAFVKDKLFGLGVCGGVARSAKETSRKRETLLPSREAFLRCMDDTDFRVRQKAYTTGTALVAAGLGGNFGLTGEGGVFDRVLMDVAVNAALIKVVDLGPFKHKVDEGVGLRRAAAGLCAVIADGKDKKAKLKEAVAAQKELHDIQIV